ncbi:mercury resistance system transport protein MerF [Marinovum sp.]|uniref:mercury resistance system transport protein MerF n=1 Tax=Marinovum sp. TaxID=2024839 RepID=UPI003A91D78C
MKDADAPAGRDGLLKVGLIGTVVVALCCVTPVLVILLGAVGLSALLGWLDYVLLPALALFIGIMIYALWRRRSSETPS